MPEESPGLVVRLPEPTGRRLRLGPFPSARDGLKFVAYAAIGAVVAGLAGPAAWLPFLGGGFLFAVYQPEGRGLDRRLHDYCRWRWRSAYGGFASPGPTVRGGLTRARSGRYLCGLTAGGAPIAFLPPLEARRRFEQYRALLRSAGDALIVRVGVEPISARPFRGPVRRGSVPVRDARAGYDELVRLLCRRRQRRRVDLFLVGSRDPTRSLEGLEDRVRDVQRNLEEMGIASARLRDRALETALRRAGFEASAGAAA